MRELAVSVSLMTRPPSPRSPGRRGLAHLAVPGCTSKPPADRHRRHPGTWLKPSCETTSRAFTCNRPQSAAGELTGTGHPSPRCRLVSVGARPGGFEIASRSSAVRHRFGVCLDVCSQTPLRRRASQSSSAAQDLRGRAALRGGLGAQGLADGPVGVGGRCAWRPGNWPSIMAIKRS
jgi:hypothetical protein